MAGLTSLLNEATLPEGNVFRWLESVSGNVTSLNIFVRDVINYYIMNIEQTSENMLLI